MKCFMISCCVWLVCSEHTLQRSKWFCKDSKFHQKQFLAYPNFLNILWTSYTFLRIIFNLSDTYGTFVFLRLMSWNTFSLSTLWLILLWIYFRNAYRSINGRVRITSNSPFQTYLPRSQIQIENSAIRLRPMRESLLINPNIFHITV